MGKRACNTTMMATDEKRCGFDTDVGNQRLVGKESKRELRVGDKVRARVVTISLNEISPRESKIGLTMRQPGLGKHEWIVEDQNKAAAGGE